MLKAEIASTSDSRPDRAAIEALLPRFIGTIEQVPPRFSAIKIDGERAYDLAREGEVIEIAPRPVTIHRLANCSTRWTQIMRCSPLSAARGTYVRAIARDLGRALGVLRCLRVAKGAGSACSPKAT